VKGLYGRAAIDAVRSGKAAHPGGASWGDQTLSAPSLMEPDRACLPETLEDRNEVNSAASA
jgi:hypothetical protein